MCGEVETHILIYIDLYFVLLLSHNRELNRSISLAATCIVPTLANGLRDSTIGSCTSFRCDSNATLSYRCQNNLHTEYIMLGPAGITCTDQDTWYPSLGTCIRGELSGTCVHVE